MTLCRRPSLASKGHDSCLCMDVATALFPSLLQVVTSLRYYTLYSIGLGSPGKVTLSNDIFRRLESDSRIIKEVGESHKRRTRSNCSKI